MPKGAGWKTPVVTRMSMMPVVSRVSVMSEVIPGEMVGRDRRSVVRA